MKLKFSIVTIFLILNWNFCAQVNLKDVHKGDSLILLEIEALKLKLSSSSDGGKGGSEIKFTKIRLQTCTDTLVTFATGFFSLHSRIVNVFTCKIDNVHDNLNKKLHDSIVFDSLGKSHQINGFYIKNIALLFGSYRMYDIPEAAFQDVSIKDVCRKNKRGLYSKKKSSFSVYQSKDRMRLYICLHNDHGTTVSRVIWVINRTKYHSRYIETVRKVQ